VKELPIAIVELLQLVRTNIIDDWATVARPPTSAKYSDARQSKASTLASQSVKQIEQGILNQEEKFKELMAASTDDGITVGESGIDYLVVDEVHGYLLGSRSGIVNDPKDWAGEQGNPRSILDLLVRIVTISVETVKIVNALPPLELVDQS
jgi:predicted helicase